MHHKRSITDFPNSYALLSGREDTRVAVTFVHGFAGDAYSTWLDFQGMIDTNDEAERWKQVDLYFYDYQTLSGSILIQSFRLRSFLERNFPKPQAEAFPDPRLATALGLNQTVIPMTSVYDSLILVGHSLGGVIIRQAVLDMASNFEATPTMESARKEQLATLLSASVKLFAPALFGFDPSGLAGFVYSFANEVPVLNKSLRRTGTFSWTNV